MEYGSSVFNVLFHCSVDVITIVGEYDDDECRTLLRLLETLVSGCTQLL